MFLIKKEMISTVLTIILFWVIFFAVTLLTHYVYNIKMVDIKPNSYWDNYPFSCFKCFTTWSLVATYIMVGFIINNWVFAVFGVILAYLFGYGLYKKEKERIIV